MHQGPRKVLKFHSYVLVKPEALSSCPLPILHTSPAFCLFIFFPSFTVLSIPSPPNCSATDHNTQMQNHCNHLYRYRPTCRFVMIDRSQPVIQHHRNKPLGFLWQPFYSSQHLFQLEQMLSCYADAFQWGLLKLNA